jgi:hypothetical protein
VLKFELFLEVLAKPISQLVYKSIFDLFQPISYCFWGTLLTKLNYIIAILLIALEIPDVVMPSWRAAPANGTP